MFIQIFRSSSAFAVLSRRFFDSFDSSNVRKHKVLAVKSNNFDVNDQRRQRQRKR